MALVASCSSGFTRSGFEEALAVLFGERFADNPNRATPEVQSVRAKAIIQLFNSSQAQEPARNIQTLQTENSRKRWLARKIGGGQRIEKRSENSTRVFYCHNFHDCICDVSGTDVHGGPIEATLAEFAFV
jgi:hypothetical protein